MKDLFGPFILGKQTKKSQVNGADVFHPVKLQEPFNPQKAFKMSFLNSKNVFNLYLKFCTQYELITG